VEPWWQELKKPVQYLDHMRLGSKFDIPTEEELNSAHNTLVQRERKSFIRLNTCWSADDLKDRPLPDREMGNDPNERYEKVRGNLRAVLAKALETFGTVQDLEFHNGHYWEPLYDDDQLLPYQSKVLPIRIPELFEEIELADSDDEEGWDEAEEEIYKQYKEYTQNFARRRSPAARATPMESVIRDLARRLVVQEYQRSPIQARTILDRNQQAIQTQTWVLQAAQEHTTLRAVLLAHPGALKHIVACLHEFDKLWRAS
jgi:hypothetical protein